MNHPFTPSLADMAKCAVCKFGFVEHTDKATCHCCPNIGPVELKYGNMLMCPSCIAREKASSDERMKPENQQMRVDAMNTALSAARQIDENIAVRTDLFNAATVAIVDLKNIIDSDESITNKPYALATELTDRFNHFKSVVFELNEQIVEAGNQQKAIQIYLNELANKLRAEEREKLKLADINYKPGAIKPKTPKPIKVRTSTKLNKADLDKYAKELGVSVFTLQMVCTSQGITPEIAANKLRKSIMEGKSEA